MASKPAKQPPTLEEYKAYTRELKGKIMRLQEKNKQLAEEVVSLKAGPQKHNLGRLLVDANIKVAKAQAVWRGVIARKKFKKLLSDKLRAATPPVIGAAGVVKPVAISSKSADAGVFSCIKHAAESRGLTLEMLFRAADRDTAGMVPLEDFRIFLAKLKLPVTQSQIAR